MWHQNHRKYHRYLLKTLISLESIFSDIKCDVIWSMEANRTNEQTNDQMTVSIAQFGKMPTLASMDHIVSQIRMIILFKLVNGYVSFFIKKMDNENVVFHNKLLSVQSSTQSLFKTVYRTRIPGFEHHLDVHCASERVVYSWRIHRTNKLGRCGIRSPDVLFRYVQRCQLRSNVLI